MRRGFKEYTIYKSLCLFHVLMSTTKEESLLTRLEALEKARHCSLKDSKNNNDHEIDEMMRRARQDVERLHIYSAQWKFVPQQYYSLSLEERAKCLQAPSIHYLCKSLLMENKKCTEQATITTTTTNNNSNNDPTNPRFFLVIVQYAATLDAKKTINFIRSLRPMETRLSETAFDIRVASEQDNHRITGYPHNSVTPFGLLDKTIPILLTDAVVPLKYFWMGGGAVDLKLRVAVSEFCRAPNVIVGDVSRPRDIGAMDMDDIMD